MGNLVKADEIFLQKQNKSQNQNGFHADIVPDFVGDADQEFAQIIDELGVSSILSERAMYRIWRMKHTGKWGAITNLNTGEPYFTSWEDFVSTVAETTGRSRQTIFDRVRTYQQLNGLGLSPDEMIQRMSEAPGLYTRALKLLVDFNVRTDTIVKFNFDPDEELDEQQGIEKLKQIVDDLGTYDSVGEALKHVERDILFMPSVKIFLNNEGQIVVSWAILDRNGSNAIISDTGSAEFNCGNTIPDWVMEQIQRKLK